MKIFEIKTTSGDHVEYFVGTRDEADAYADKLDGDRRSNVYIAWELSHEQAAERGLYARDDIMEALHGKS